MPRNTLPLIEAVRDSRLLRIGRDATSKQLRFESAPPTLVRGYYWIYTDFSLDELVACAPSPDKGGVNLARLAGLHRDLGNVCTLAPEGFRLVYSGRAGNSVGGIRGRLGQHFNGGDGTGALHICRSSLSDLPRWRYSYATIDDKGSISADVPSSYDDSAHVERIWRLHHGWPLFCTQ